MAPSLLFVSLFFYFYLRAVPRTRHTFQCMGWRKRDQGLRHKNCKGDYEVVQYLWFDGTPQLLLTQRVFLIKLLFFHLAICIIFSLFPLFDNQANELCHNNNHLRHVQITS